MPPCLILSIIRYRLRVGGAIQGKEYCSPLHPGVVAIERGAFRLPSTKVGQLLYIYIYMCVCVCVCVCVCILVSIHLTRQILFFYIISFLFYASSWFWVVKWWVFIIEGEHFKSTKLITVSADKFTSALSEEQMLILKCLSQEEFVPGNAKWRWHNI